MSIASVQFVEMVREATQLVKKDIFFCVRCLQKTRHVFMWKEGRWEVYGCEKCGNRCVKREII